jgi:hypothetical protein
VAHYGFEKIDSDGVTWVKAGKKECGAETKLLLTVHVDDGLADCNDPDMYMAFLDALSKDFDLSDSGELSWLLGCKVEQSPGKVRLHQEKYCNGVLKRFQMSDCNPVSTPCEANMHLSDADCPPLDKRNPEVVRDCQMCIGELLRWRVRFFDIWQARVRWASRTAGMRETLALFSTVEVENK